MREFQEKNKVRKFLYSRIASVLLLLLIVFFGRATWTVYTKERESAVNAAQAQTGLKKLLDRQTVLSSEITRLHSQEGIEEEIRSKYSVEKPGENMIIIVDKNQDQSTSTVSHLNWWQRFKLLFK